jgi:hypothetical protein
MTDAEFLLWVRGPAFTTATFIMCAGLVIRFLEIFLLGRKADLAEARGSAFAGGFRTMFKRSIPDAGSFERSGFTLVSGYIFHIGLFIVIFLFVPHILVFEAATGLSWPGLPSNIIDERLPGLVCDLPALAHRLSGISPRWFVGAHADRPAHSQRRITHGAVPVHQTVTRIYPVDGALVQRCHRRL